MSRRLKGSLGALASSWARRMTVLAKGFAPNHLKDNIKSKSTEVKEGTWSITTTATGADAHAQEHGSGLRTRDNRRRKAKYPIRPKTKKVLAFHWEVANANPERFKFAPDGRVILPIVMHPGIPPYKNRGYIRPAFDEIRKQARK